MKTLYLDCSMGAAGDMLQAALYELLDDKEAFLEKVNALGLEGVTVKPIPMTKCGILGTHMDVLVNGESEGTLQEAHEHHHDHDHDHHHDHHHHDDHDNDHEHHHHDHEHSHNEHHEHSHNHECHEDADHVHETHTHDHDHHHDHEHSHGDHDHDHHHDHHHHHASMKDIENIIDGLNVSDNVKANAKKVYALIAEAESHAHGVDVSEIHFHEVGTMDAIADVTVNCMLLEELNPEKIVASPVNVGSGHVHCAHGILPVPAPATAYILRDIPMYSGHIKSELCTPTGAALLKTFADSFSEMPVMTVSKIGYGMGRKDFEQANCVRAFLGNTKEDSEQIVELSCNIDDMTPEKIGFATEEFLKAGALEAYTIPVGMKKSRPGILLSVICREDKKEKMVELIFKHTTTLGIRENISRRFALKRDIITKDTKFGPVRIKRSEGYGVTREKIEYEDLARIAREENISIEEVESLI